MIGIFSGYTRGYRAIVVIVFVAWGKLKYISRIFRAVGIDKESFPYRSFGRSKSEQIA